MICFLAGSSHIMSAAMQKSKGHLCELEPGLPAAAALSAAPPSAEPHAPMQTRLSAAALPAPVPCCTTDSVAAHLIINQSINQSISQSNQSISSQSINHSTFPVFGTLQGSQQTLTGKTKNTDVIEHMACIYIGQWCDVYTLSRYCGVMSIGVDSLVQSHILHVIHPTDRER